MQVVWDPATPNEFVSVGADASVSFWMLDEHGTEVCVSMYMVTFSEIFILITFKVS